MRQIEKSLTWALDASYRVNYEVEHRNQEVKEMYVSHDVCSRSPPLLPLCRHPSSHGNPGKQRLVSVEEVCETLSAWSSYSSSRLNRLGILAPAAPGRRGLRGAGDVWSRHCAQAAGVGAHLLRPPHGARAAAPPHCTCSSRKRRSTAKLNLIIHHKIWFKITVSKLNQNCSQFIKDSFIHQ